MRGRHPSGPEYVAQLHGSDLAKRRARVILETLTGQLRVQEACQALGISEQRFAQLRQEMLQAAVERLEARPPGRTRRPAVDDTARALEEQVRALEDEVRAAQLREEIALSLPQVVHPAPPPEKKTKAPKRRARRGWWKKS